MKLPLKLTRERLTQIENRLGWGGSHTWPVPYHIHLWAVAAEKLLNERDACKNILGYDASDLLDKVSRYKKYAESEIEMLRAGHGRVSAYVVKLQEMRRLPPEDISLIIGALDSMAVALADKGHVWTDGEKTIYETSVAILRDKPMPREDA